MFDKSLQFILRQRLLVLLVGAIVLLLGAIAWVRLPIDAFPDVTNVQVMILTEAQGLSPEEVERLITFPIETEMSGLPDVRLVRSLSQSGLSQVVVIFEDRVDTYFARQLVFQRLAMARDKLPAGSPRWAPSAPAWARSTSTRSSRDTIAVLMRACGRPVPASAPSAAGRWWPATSI